MLTDFLMTIFIRVGMFITFLPLLVLTFIDNTFGTARNFRNFVIIMLLGGLAVAGWAR